MKEWVSFSPERWITLALAVLVIPAALLIAYRWNPALSHNLAETFSIVVACGVFMFTWNARNIIDNDYFIFLGVACLFVGVIDFFHTLTFDPAFSRVTHPNSIELWFIARLIQSLALDSAPYFASRRTRP